MDEKTLKIIAAVLLCTTIGSGALAFQYNYQLSQLREDYEYTVSELEDYTVLVDIMIDDGETVTWYNDTRINVGASLLEATLEAVEMEYQVSEYGAFITSIGGLESDLAHYWLWSYYDGGWEMGAVGADQYVLHDGDIVAWTYTSFE